MCTSRGAGYTLGGLLRELVCEERRVRVERVRRDRAPGRKGVARGGVCGAWRMEQGLQRIRVGAVRGTERGANGTRRGPSAFLHAHTRCFSPYTNAGGHLYSHESREPERWWWSTPGGGVGDGESFQTPTLLDSVPKTEPRRKHSASRARALFGFHLTPRRYPRYGTLSDTTEIVNPIADDRHPFFGENCLSGRILCYRIVAGALLFLSLVALRLFVFLICIALTPYRYVRSIALWILWWQRFGSDSVATA